MMHLRLEEIERRRGWRAKTSCRRDGLSNDLAATVTFGGTRAAGPQRCLAVVPFLPHLQLQMRRCAGTVGRGLRGFRRPDCGVRVCVHFMIGRGWQSLRHSALSSVVISPPLSPIHWRGIICAGVVGPLHIRRTVWSMLVVSQLETPSRMRTEWRGHINRGI